MRLLLLVSTVLLAPSCVFSVQCEGQFTASEQWDLEGRRALETAAKRWESFSGYPVDVTYGPDPGACFIRPVVKILDHASACGLYRARNGEIQISDVCELTGANLEAALLHEIGHSWGLQHVPQEIPAVMNPALGVLDFTTADAAECQRQGACRFMHTPY